MIPPGHLELLFRTGAANAPHSGRTLLDHLRGTHDLLTAWGAAEHVRTVGLFHSIYGTSIYQISLVSPYRRDCVRERIGADAEELVYLFSVAARPEALVSALEQTGVTVAIRSVPGQEISLSRKTYCELLEIECANLIEQRLGFTDLSAIQRATARDPGLVSQAACQAVAGFLSRDQPL